MSATSVVRFIAGLLRERERLVRRFDGGRNVLVGLSYGPGHSGRDSGKRRARLRIRCSNAVIARLSSFSPCRRLLRDVTPDAQTFERVRVRRAKAKRGRMGKLQPFVVPEPMRPILRAWHELHGRPTSGPVFPVTKGPRAGQHRVEHTSYAARLRRELWRMGVRVHAIHNDTPVSKRVDFHSFRRAFATSLAEAGVNEQRAMMLTSHSDSKVHARYVQETLAMQAIPEGAVPPIPLVRHVGKRHCSA